MIHNFQCLHAPKIDGEGVHPLAIGSAITPAPLSHHQSHHYSLDMSLIFFIDSAVSVLAGPDVSVSSARHREPSAISSLLGRLCLASSPPTSLRYLQYLSPMLHFASMGLSENGASRAKS